LISLRPAYRSPMAVNARQVEKKERLKEVRDTRVYVVS